MFFRPSDHRTWQPSLSMREINSSLVEAYRMHWSMVFISRNFQLSPLAAERYSRLLMRFCFTCFSDGGRVSRLWAAQIASLVCRWAWRSAALWWSFLPFWKLTLLTIRWLCRWSVSI